MDKDFDLRVNNLYIGLSWTQSSYYGWYPGDGEIIDYVDREEDIFVDFDNSDSIVDLHLINTSPAINTGIDARNYLPYRVFPLFDFDVDIDGNLLNSDGIWDIGAYGY